MAKIKISIICPTYNSEKFITRTLNMLLNQKKLPDEVIFCDDGSNDNTFKILKSYKKLFQNKKIIFKLIKSKHRGPGSARNLALAKSTSNYICFLDSDDAWHNNKILILKNYIKKFPNKNFFIHWEKFITSKKNTILKHGNLINHKEDLFLQLYKSNFFSTSAVTCKKNDFGKKLRFDKNLKNAQDYDLWLKISNDIKLKIIPKILGCYIDRKDNITNRYYFKKISALLKISFRYKPENKFKIFFFKVLRILFSLQWFKVN